ncbi:unnamed protein product [Phyllotreta striolata]|uniref:Cytochrome P450 n=1 Tax=Phyllotreta striolata TaxID=444603 RepID=A0A9N9TQE0_PHYSR|nr:unnamed protein product [Phyllotreta striolata]
MLLTNSTSTDVIIGISTIAIIIYLYVKHQYSYWKRLGVPQLKPTFPLGNYQFALPKGLQMGAYTDHYYRAFKKMGAPYGGVYIGLTPNLVITDADVAKTILVNDFNNFTDRNMYSSKHQPLSVNLLSQKGDEWKSSRAKFTALFTTSKLKLFIDFASQGKQDLITYLDHFADGKKDVAIHQVTSLFVADIISMILFGINANSFNSENTDFKNFGRAVFDSFTPLFQLKLLMTHCYPKLAQFLGIGNLQKEIEDFGNAYVPKAVEYRMKNNVRGTDFLQLLIDAKEAGMDLTMDEMVSQSFIFMSGGLETSSSSSMIALYELAKNEEYQTKVREEIYRIKEKYEGKTSYDSLMEHTYLQQVLSEVLRLYPLITNVYRVCVQDYTMQGRDLVIEKGTPVIFPLIGFHRDPDYFPEPLKFDPSRFDDKNNKHKGYFPFGAGPRNCVAARLGIIQSKLAIVAIIENYEISLSPKTPEALELVENTFTLSFKNDIYLKLKKIQK